MITGSGFGVQYNVGGLRLLDQHDIVSPSTWLRYMGQRLGPAVAQSPHILMSDAELLLLQDSMEACRRDMPSAWDDLLILSEDGRIYYVTVSIDGPNRGRGVASWFVAQSGNRLAVEFGGRLLCVIDAQTRLYHRWVSQGRPLYAFRSEPRVSHPNPSQFRHGQN